MVVRSRGGLLASSLAALALNIDVTGCGDQTSDADLARYGNVVRRYYGMVDSLLGAWMRRAEEDGATLVVHSDHGFKWGEDRSCERGSRDGARPDAGDGLDGGVCETYRGRRLPRGPLLSAAGEGVAVGHQRTG